MKVTRLTRALASSKNSLHIRISDALRVSPQQFNYAQLTKIILDFDRAPPSAAASSAQPQVFAIGEGDSRPLRMQGGERTGPLVYKHSSQRAKRQFKGVCDICTKAKMQLASFPRSQNHDRQLDLQPGMRIGMDVLIMLNTPSRERYRYVLILVDHASKYRWVYPLESRDDGSVLENLMKFLDKDFPAFGVKLQYIHSDGGADLVSDEILTVLHQRGISTSHTPRDTPEMNSTVERRLRDIKERTLSMLLHSGLPVPFWWLTQ